MKAEDSMSDDVFEMEDDHSSTVTSVVSGGLTPATVERPLEKTPSPTGYRDYKPPAEVLSNNYSTTFRTTSDFDSVRSALKRDQEREDNFTHKVRRIFKEIRQKTKWNYSHLQIIFKKKFLVLFTKSHLFCGKINHTLRRYRVIRQRNVRASAKSTRCRPVDHHVSEIQWN